MLRERGVLARDSQGFLLGLLIKGPIIIFAVASIAILFAFGYSNRHGAAQDSGMNVDQLAWSFTAALGILAASSSVAVSYLFSLSAHPGTEPGEVAPHDEKGVVQK